MPHSRRGNEGDLMTANADVAAEISIEELRRLAGDIDDEKISEILALQPSVADIEMAVMRAAGEDAVLNIAGHTLDAKVAAIVEILTADQGEDEHEQ